MNQSAPSERLSGRLWFGVLGGALAWTLHFLVAYALAESACATALGGLELFGFSGLAVLLLGATLIFGLLALSAALSAYGTWRRWRGRDGHGAAEFMGSAGLLLSGLFTFVIVIQSLPIFFIGVCGS